MNALVHGGGAQEVLVGLPGPCPGGAVGFAGGNQGGFPAALQDLKGTALCCLRVFC